MGKGKGKPGKGKGKNKNKGKGKHHGKNGKKGFHEMEEHDDAQDTRTGQDCTAWTDTSWDHADSWTDAAWWSSDWGTDVWAAPAWEQAARQLPPSQPAQEQPNPAHGGSDERQQSVQDEEDKIGSTIGALGMKFESGTR